MVAYLISSPFFEGLIVIDAFKLLKSRGLGQYYEFSLVGEIDYSHPVN